MAETAGMPTKQKEPESILIRSCKEQGLSHTSQTINMFTVRQCERERVIERER